MDEDVVRNSPVSGYRLLNIVYNDKQISKIDILKDGEHIVFDHNMEMLDESDLLEITDNDKYCKLVFYRHIIPHLYQTSERQVTNAMLFYKDQIQRVITFPLQ